MLYTFLSSFRCGVSLRLLSSLAYDGLMQSSSLECLWERVGFFELLDRGLEYVELQSNICRAAHGISTALFHFQINAEMIFMYCRPKSIRYAFVLGQMQNLSA